jgi:hypothetical protein
MMPRILGVLSRGLMPLQIAADRWYQDGIGVSGLKGVTKDLPGATPSFFSADQSEAVRSIASSASAASSLGDYTKMVRSSAYEAMLRIGPGILEIEWLKRAGKMNEPWGTLEWLALSGWCSEVEAGCLPPSEVAAQPADQVVV